MEQTNQEQRVPGQEAGNPSEKVDRERIRPGTGVPLDDGSGGQAIEAPDGPLNTDAGTLAADPPAPGEQGQRQGADGQSQNR